MDTTDTAMGMATDTMTTADGTERGNMNRNRGESMNEHKHDRERAEDAVSDQEKIDLFRLLNEFWRACQRLFWIPVALAVLGGAFFGFRAWWSYTPMYQSEVTFTIQTGNNGNRT